MFISTIRNCTILVKMFIPAEFMIMAIGIIEGALSLATDACRGLCDNIEGTFCEGYSAICEYCDPNCRIEDQNGCVDTCNAWTNSTSTSDPTRAIPRQSQHISVLSTMFPRSSTGNDHTEGGTTVVPGTPISDTNVQLSSAILGLICALVVLVAILLLLGLSYLFYKHYTLNCKKIKQCWREENPGIDLEMHERVDRDDGRNEAEGSGLLAEVEEGQNQSVDIDPASGQPSRDAQGPETCMTKGTAEEQLSPDSGFKSTGTPPTEIRPLTSINKPGARVEYDSPQPVLLPVSLVSANLQGAVPSRVPRLASPGNLQISTHVQDGTNYSAKVVVDASLDPLAAFQGVRTTTGD